jgi:cyclopropane fatty-acyl-phospholipid synthase-like methyltransferase
VFTNLVVPMGGRVLDLCCGDGYYARRFYSNRAREVVAVDRNQDAIAYAKFANPATNVTYRVADIRNEMPDGPFDAVIWGGAIEHFTEEEIQTILAAVRARLTPGGVLAGDTIIASDDGHKALEHHEREFRDERDIVTMLSPPFSHAYGWRSRFEHRTELYFYASDDRSSIPLLPEAGLLVGT